ncbi:MAG: hypothetical protein AB1512_22715 [Thermodesulfobacteriota bacterium]
MEGESTLDHEIKLSKGKGFRAGHAMPLDDNTPLAKLRYYLVISSFKVPYAGKRDYETEVYRIIKKPDDKSYAWQPLERSEADRIICDFVRFVRSSPVYEVVDYQNEEGRVSDIPVIVLLREVSKRISTARDFLKDF